MVTKQQQVENLVSPSSCRENTNISLPLDIEFAQDIQKCIISRKQLLFPLLNCYGIVLIIRDTLHKKLFHQQECKPRTTHLP
jgi:hypothetical protein